MNNQKPTIQSPSLPTRKYEDTLNRLAKFLEQTKIRNTA